jgi:hypothetical protein
MADHLTDMEKLQKQWDDALANGAFKSAKKPPVPAPDVYSPTNYGMSDAMTQVASQSEKLNDADYWNAIFRLSKGEQVDTLPQGGRLDPLNENRRCVSDTPNPIPCWTKGMDQKYEKSSWCDLKDIEKLVKMKEDLHALGDKLASNDAKEGSSQTEAILTKIKNLQSEIDDLSTSLTEPPAEM